MSFIDRAILYTKTILKYADDIIYFNTNILFKDVVIALYISKSLINLL